MKSCYKISCAVLFVVGFFILLQQKNIVFAGYQGKYGNLNDQIDCGAYGGYCATGHGQAACGGTNGNRWLYDDGWCANPSGPMACCYGGGTVSDINAPCNDLGMTLNNDAFCTSESFCTQYQSNKSAAVKYQGGWCQPDQICCDPLPSCNTGPTSTSSCQYTGQTNTCGTPTQTVTYTTYNATTSCNQSTQTIACGTVENHCNSGYQCPSSGTGTCVQSPTSPPPTSTAGPTIATVHLVLNLPGIGKTGPAGVLPKHASHRAVTVELYDGSVANPGAAGTQPYSAVNGSLTLDQSGDNNTGYFTNYTTLTFTIPTNHPTNNQYKILVKIPQYLYQLMVNPNPTDSGQPNLFTIDPTAGSNTQIISTPLTLYAGDIETGNGDINSIGAYDYTALKTCFDAHNYDSASCPKTSDGIDYADLDDNGKVDIVDFNIWIRSIYQLSQVNGACADGACNGQ